jgi:hypothetical protein
VLEPRRNDRGGHSAARSVDEYVEPPKGDDSRQGGQVMSDRNLEWLFRHVDDGRLGEGLESFPALLNSDAGLLRTGKRDVRSGI